MNFIKIERQERVVTVTLHRPEVLNALSSGLLAELVEALRPLDRDPGTGCFVITGSERAFAAGADIKEMEPKTSVEMFAEDYFAGWDAFAALRTPKIAAVSGYALGGGCELAMMCDIILAGESATFGQPEIKLGVIPGIGGTQRLTKLVGKAKAMDLILTGRTMGAHEAERSGLVSRVVPDDRLTAEAAAIAATVASYGKPAAMAAREAVERALEVGLREGLLFERRSFHALFATEDQSEGMAAFREKRAPRFTGR
ncbi:enoyl-CoA hydratase-related protein [Streptomyces sp. RTd22]|uniref:enoyl-CoA hydratase-related protein n=1 Tax=Streptomyces sp. RTd22 TaxID=1841249 RepID=UPI0007C514CB|nr:enoyl-CoA hydratase-related protein [Streptomyces sp. RTd22]